MICTFDLTPMSAAKKPSKKVHGVNDEQFKQLCSMIEGQSNVMKGMLEKLANLVEELAKPK